MFPEFKCADRVQMSLVFTDSQDWHVPLCYVLLQGNFLKLQVKCLHWEKRFKGLTVLRIGNHCSNKERDTYINAYQNMMKKVTLYPGCIPYMYRTYFNSKWKARTLTFSKDVDGATIWSEAGPALELPGRACNKHSHDPLPVLVFETL